VPRPPISKIGSVLDLAPDAYAKIRDHPVELPFWRAWATFFSDVMREDVGEGTVSSMFSFFQSKEWTNGDLNMACGRILETCRSFPVPADFVRAFEAVSPEAAAHRR